MNFPSVSQFSIAQGTGGMNPPELYLPIWWWSGSSSAVAGGGQGLGTYFVPKGTGGPVNTSSSSAETLHTLNSNWKASQQFAFEAAIWTTSGYTAYAELWDLTSNTGVSASQISTTSTTATVVRSGNFTLIPGHKYGITVSWSSSSGIYLTDASLIVFPQ